MKSPFTEGEVKSMMEPRELTFRKEKFSYISHFYLCVDTKEQFTTTELDTININQVYNQYRTKYGIPFPDEILNIRESYGLSASKMSEILGLGANQYRLYENGEMPSEAIGKTLKSIMNPAVFAIYVKNARNQFEPHEFEKINEKLERAIKRSVNTTSPSNIFSEVGRSSLNGYAPKIYARAKSIMLYFINRCEGVFSTKMNKLLFYTDFLSYKKRGIGMTGFTYRAIQYGPVPERWNVIYGSIEGINSEIVAFPSGNSGEKLCSNDLPDMDVFTSEDISILETVYNKFKALSSNDISTISHKEDAWLKYKDTKNPIDYNEAFTLKAL